MSYHSTWDFVSEHCMLTNSKMLARRSICDSCVLVMHYLILLYHICCILGVEILDCLQSARLTGALSYGTPFLDSEPNVLQRPRGNSSFLFHTGK
jgi:hypothetical protein